MGIPAGAVQMQLMADISDFIAKMNTVEKATGAAMDGVRSSIDAVTKSALGIAAAFAAGFSVSAISNMVNTSIKAAAGLHDMAIQGQLSVEALSGLAAVGKYTDTSAETLVGSMNKLAKNLSTTSEDGKGAAMAIKALGLDFDRFKSMAPDQQMLAVAKAMDQFQDGSGKAAVAIALYGKEGAKLLPFMKDLVETGDLQAKVTTAQAKAADDYDDNLKRLRASGDAWKKELSMGILPAMNDVSAAFVQVFNGAGGLRDTIRTLSEDGSLDRWARASIKALSYLLDGLDGLRRMFSLVWNSAQVFMDAIATTFKVVSAGIAGGFTEEGRAYIAQARAQFQLQRAELRKSMTEDLYSPLLGQQLRTAMDGITAVGTAAAENKPKLEANFAAMAKGADDAAKLDKAYSELLNNIRAKIDTQQQELAGGKALNEAQKLEIEIARMVADGKLRAADAASAQTRALVAQLAAVVTLRDEEKAAMKVAQERQKLHQDEEKAIRAALEAQQAAAHAALQAQQQRVDSLTDEAAAVALSREQNITLAQAVERVAIAKLEEAQAQKFREGSEGWQALQREIDKRRELLKLIETKDLRDQETEGWRTLFGSIDSTAHNVWTNVMQGGQDAFSRIGNTLKAAVLDVLYQMTVKRWIISIGASISGGAVSAATSGISGLGGLGSLFGGSGGIMNGLSAWGEGGSVLGMLSNPGLYSGSELLGAALPGVGAALGGIMLASKLFNSKGGPKTEGGYSNIAGLVAATNGRTYQNGFYGGANDSAAQALVQSLGSGYAGILAALGVKGGALTGQAFVDADPNGTSGNALDFQAALNGRTIYNRFDALGTNRAGMTDAEAQGAAQLAVQTALVEALKATDLGGPLNAYLASVTTQGSSLESLAAVIADVQGVGALQKQFSELQGSSVEAVKALAQAAGGFDALAQVLTTRRAWQDQLDLLQGKVTQDELDLQRDLASTTDEATQALIRQVYAQRQANAATTAAAQAAEAAAAAAQAAAEAQKSAAIDAYNRAIDAERNRLQALADASAATVDRIQSIFDLLDESTRSLYGSVASTATLQAAQGRAFISTALALANAGGVLPSQSALQNAIGAATAGLSARPYASRQDSDFARLVLAGELRQLQAKTGTQLTAAQQALDVERSQLAALNAQAEAMQQQLDALNGVHTSVLSVDEAVRNLTALMFPGGGTDTNTAQAMAAGASGGAVFGGGVGSGSGGYVFNPADFGGVDATTYATSLGGILAALGGGGGAVVQAVGELREEVRELRAVQEQAAESAARTASVLQGNEGTILVRTV